MLGYRHQHFPRGSFTTNFWKRCGVSRVNCEVPRLSKFHEDARRCSKNFQQVWYELEMFKVCRDDMPWVQEGEIHTR